MIWRDAAQPILFKESQNGLKCSYSCSDRKITICLIPRLVDEKHLKLEYFFRNLAALPASLLSGASVLTALLPETPLMARFCA